MTTELERALAELPITIEARCLGLDKDSDGWEHFAWRVKLTRTDSTQTFETPYRCGVAHCHVPSWVERNNPRNAPNYRDPATRPLPPTVGDVVASVLLSSDAADKCFEEWASDIGYNTDSRKALKTYLACQAEYLAMRRFLGMKLTSKLQELEH